ncbi:hypothetical protein IV203_006077 [Nitzschia inconspicua]|uniref:Cation-transporting P-type ATPase C-terminal domain-containing protein n=1 Tax=Nitzschia inconspicua TaxID=303405 RepID=A0A9K3PGZ2_9STRA|nr:hypothetical protein IV203_006077 [Nitzschia inconspicua]
MWLLFRYRYSTSQGTDNLKRRMISRFLRELEKQEGECVDDDSVNFLHQNNKIDLVGTSLTAIYPVYRLSLDSDGKIAGASWSRIPTLLLVEGDRIALQIGDVAPAICRIMKGDVSKTFEKGQKISLESCEKTMDGVVGNLPKGRTTLPPNSDELLDVCNNMQIFQLMETPLEGFLREPEHDAKPPQLFRQLDSIRGVLFFTGIASFVLTLVILLGRFHQLSQDLFHLLPVPFLAALGSFPLVSPSCLIFVEALGSARILTSYHPVASRVRKDSSMPQTAETNVDLLILRYFLAICGNRLSLQNIGSLVDDFIRKSKRLDAGTTPLVRIPPASLNLLYKLGVATAFTLIDDELVCEPQSIPQQLLIPSAKGLKLLDLCPAYESDDEEDSESDSSVEMPRHRQKSFDPEQNDDSDSDSDDALKDHHHVPSKKKARRRLLRKSFNLSSRRSKEEAGETSNSDLSDYEVQFEDPSWWQHLPSLKCIGLACLLVEQKDELPRSKGPSHYVSVKDASFIEDHEFASCKKALVHLVCKERRSIQLRSLARCIGFSTKPGLSGPLGDLSPFTEKNRLHVISTAQMKERLQIDFHERGSEESRWWGLLRADSTSVIVQDSRSGAYQLFSVGDPRVVLRATHEAWQGENNTILPLSSYDRKTILETTDSWKLADLDVEAFSYAPIPHTFENRCLKTRESKFYLLDNVPRGEKQLLPVQKDKAASAEWTLLQNQIFLGVLGSLVTPRSETQGLLSSLQDAGVRFVYFSPRNMRRQKEIASQMGIDVAWNCAISLRPLDQGEEDPHRMVSNYADWDVNAKLPHGIESVKQHLKDVDNVPLLVSLFTDVTKETTKDMIEIFQEYNDTVVVVGLSHLPKNSTIFSAADLAIGVDVLSDCISWSEEDSLYYNALLPSEVNFASAISAHFCGFRLKGISSMEHMPTILAQGRASLSASTNAGIFLLSGYLAFSFFALLNVCSISVALPYIPIVGAILYLLVILPLVGLPITMSDPDQLCMKQVPPKNDVTVDFGKREGKIFYVVSFLKAIPPAVFPQLLYLIAFGELMIEHEFELVQSRCSSNIEPGGWVSVIRCDALNGYSGTARDSAVALSIAELLLCVTVSSASFLYRTLPIWVEPPWRRNHIWVMGVVVAILVIITYLLVVLESGTSSVLSWYYYILAFCMPFLCLFWNEILKRPEKNVLDRAEKLRRLQFETRLGMWSPK